MQNIRHQLAKEQIFNSWISLSCFYSTEGQERGNRRSISLTERRQQLYTLFSPKVSYANC